MGDRMKAFTKAIWFLETLAASRPAHVVRVAERGVMLPTGKEQHPRLTSMQAQKRSFSPKIWHIVGMKYGAQSLVLRFNKTKATC